MGKCKQFMRSALLRKCENMEGSARSAGLWAWMLGVRTGVEADNRFLQPGTRNNKGI